MPKKAKELSALEVKRLVEPGMHAVGTVPGLHLQVLPSGGRTWVLRVTVGDQPGSGKQRRREVGLGGYPEVTLAMAHEKARAMRDQLKAGVDPVAEKQAARSALRAVAAAVITFEEAAKQYIAAHESGWRNEKHGDQWRNTLRVHAEPVLGKLIVSDIQVAHVLKVLEPIWQEKTETALGAWNEQTVDCLIPSGPVASRVLQGPGSEGVGGHSPARPGRRAALAPVR